MDYCVNYLFIAFYSHIIYVCVNSCVDCFYIYAWILVWIVFMYICVEPCVSDYLYCF